MTIDTIAARNKRIKELEAERDEWRELALANEGRAQAAEARVAELERIHSEVMLQGEAATIRRLQSKLARAERLAEAAEAMEAAHEFDCDWRSGRDCVCNWPRLREALDAFRSTEPQPAAESESHPDTVRLDWLMERDGEFTREGIDRVMREQAAREAGSDG